MRKFYRPLLLLLLLTLPFRGMAALGMLPGALQHDAPAAAMSMGDMHDCEHMHDTGHAPAGEHTCSFCSDCCSIAMTGPVAPVLMVADFQSSPDRISPERYSGFQPEGLERPPRHPA